MTTASRTASAYSVEKELDGEFSVFPFDQFGRPIPSHPLTSVRFPSVGAALDAIAAGAGATSGGVPYQGLLG
jgi:hypothetical protein